MSCTPLVSPATRLEAIDSNATYRPSALIWPDPESALDWAPPGPTLTRVVVPVCRSRTKMSCTPLVSSGIWVAAADWKTTKRASALMPPPELSVLCGDSTPADDTLTRVVGHIAAAAGDGMAESIATATTAVTARR